MEPSERKKEFAELVVGSIQQLTENGRNFTGEELKKFTAHVKEKFQTIGIFKDYVEISHKGAKDKGFWDKERNVGEMLMLIVSELGEAQEAHRKGRFGLEQKDTFEDELADAFIRLFDMCGGLGIDIEKQIRWKLGYNKTRPRLHGKRY